MLITKKQWNLMIERVLSLHNRIEAMEQFYLNKINELQQMTAEHDKIIKNQPLIKKYQKTLDIFLKNAESDKVNFNERKNNGKT